MNHQELFGTQSYSHETPLDTSYLPFFKTGRRGLCDVQLPRFFSGWPYFIIVLAALLMGSAKVTSQDVPNPNPKITKTYTHSLK